MNKDLSAQQWISPTGFKHTVFVEAEQRMQLKQTPDPRKTSFKVGSTEGTNASRNIERDGEELLWLEVKR